MSASWAAEAETYESKHQRPLAATHFARRLLGHLAWVCALLGGSQGLGIWGYHRLEGLSGLDAFLNAAMLLGGMGPLHAPQTPEGKLFAGLYALYAGLVFIVATALLLSPVLHRLRHHFHRDEER